MVLHHHIFGFWLASTMKSTPTSVSSFDWSSLTAGSSSNIPTTSNRIATPERRRRRRRHSAAWAGSWRKSCTPQTPSPSSWSSQSRESLFEVRFQCSIWSQTLGIIFSWDRVKKFPSRVLFCRKKTNQSHLSSSEAENRMSKSNPRWCNLFFVFPMHDLTRTLSLPLPHSLSFSLHIRRLSSRSLTLSHKITFSYLTMFLSLSLRHRSASTPTDEGEEQVGGTDPTWAVRVEKKTTSFSDLDVTQPKADQHIPCPDFSSY